MFRAIYLCLLLVLLAGCGDPITIEFGPLADDERRLPDHRVKSRATTALYRLQVESRSDDAVTLAVALADGATEGMHVGFVGESKLLPKGRAGFRVSVTFPKGFGPFACGLVMTSPDLPGWTRTYELKGERVDEPLSGRYMFHSPAAVDLGTVREGQEYKFNLSLASEGDKVVTVDLVEPEDDEDIRLPAFEPGMTIEPRGAMQLNGIIRIPDSVSGDRYFGSLMIRSNAANAPVIRVQIKGKIRREYSVHPPSLPGTSVQMIRPTRFDITVRSAEDASPFLIRRVRGLDPYFELADALPTKPAKSFVLGLKIRKDAPTGVKMVRGKIRIEVAAASSGDSSLDGKAVEWPYELRVLPPIYVQPSKIRFGTLDRSKMQEPVTHEIRLVATPGRKYKVTSVRAEYGRFTVRTIAVQGMPVRVQISLPAFAAAGNYVDRIVIETDDPAVPRLHVPVTAVVR